MTAEPVKALSQVTQALNLISSDLVPAISQLWQTIEESENARNRLEQELESLRTRPDRLREALNDLASAASQAGYSRTAIRHFAASRVPKSPQAVLAMQSAEFEALLGWLRDAALSAYTASRSARALESHELASYVNWLCEAKALKRPSARIYRTRLIAAAEILQTSVLGLEKADLTKVPYSHRTAVRRFLEYTRMSA